MASVISSIARASYWGALIAYIGLMLLGMRDEAYQALVVMCLTLGADFGAECFEWMNEKGSSDDRED